MFTDLNVLKSWDSTPTTVFPEFTISSDLEVKYFVSPAFSVHGAMFTPTINPCSDSISRVCSEERSSKTVGVHFSTVCKP